MSQRRTNRSTRDTEAVADVAGLDKLVKECVRYIVCREGSKIPIKRSDIIKHLNTTCQSPTKQVKTVISEAQKVLHRVYGYKLIEEGTKGGVQYLVVLAEDCESLPSTVTDGHHRKLLVAALTHIFMSGAPVKEEEMWKFLTEAGLLEENNDSGRKVLTTTLTRQGYLEYFKDGEGDLARFVFKWGRRAVEEVPKLFLLNKMAEALDKSADYWCEQYKSATEEVQQPA